MNLNDFFKSFVVVNVHFHAYTARARITAEDLGIVETPAVKEALSLGVHRLLPSEAFDEVNAAARKVMFVRDTHGVRMAMIEGARLVASDRLAKCLEELKTAREEYNAAADRFAENYEAKRDEHLPVIAKALRDAAKTPEAAADALQRIKSLYPSKSAVRAKFGTDWDVFTLQAPSADLRGLVATEADQVKGLIRGAVEELRGEIAEKVKTLIALAMKGGKLNEKSINAALETIERVEGLNRNIGDRELAAHCATLRQAIKDVSTAKQRGTRSGERATASLIPALNEMATNLEAGVEQAVADAEAAITTMGKRKLAL